MSIPTAWRRCRIRHVRLLRQRPSLQSPAIVRTRSIGTIPRLQPPRHHLLRQCRNRRRRLRIISHFQINFPCISSLTRELDPLIKFTILEDGTQVDAGIPDQQRVLRIVAKNGDFDAAKICKGGGGRAVRTKRDWETHFVVPEGCLTAAFVRFRSFCSGG